MAIIAASYLALVRSGEPRDGDVVVTVRPELRLVARDTAHENALTSRITSAANVSKVMTLQTIRTARDITGVPVEEPETA